MKQFKSLLLEAVSKSQAAGEIPVVLSSDAEAEILRIRRAWESGRATRASAIKMIAAYANLAHEALGTFDVVRIHKNARAGQKELERMSSDLEAQDIPFAEKLLRDRLRDLSEGFGSVRNLDAFREALVVYLQRVKAGRYFGQCMTETRHSTPRVAMLDKGLLVRLLWANLGKDLVSFPRKNPFTGKKEVFQTLLSPEELAELIALKLVLGVHHQAIRTPRVVDEEAHLRRLASWLQRRTDRPFFGEGDQNPSQLALHPRDRVINQEPDSDLDDEAEIKALGVRKILPSGLVRDYVGHLDEVRTRVREVEREIVIAVKDGNPITKTITEQVVRSNVVEFDIPSLPERDRDLLVSPMMPTVLRDRRKPLASDGSVQLTYVGPSLVQIKRDADGRPIPVKASRCEMHDGALWAIWKRSGGGGPVPACPHCHLMKLMLNPGIWEPRLRISNEEENEEDWEEDPQAPMTIPARKDFVHIVKFVNRWGQEKERLEFDDEGMYLPLIGSEFRDFINRCLWTGLFRAPPVLETCHKRGVLSGRLRDDYERTLSQLRGLQSLGSDSLGLEEELLRLQRIRRSYDRWFRTLHLFLPISPRILRLEKLPRVPGLALRVQVKGSLASLIWILKEYGGMEVRDTWEGTRPTWKFVKREWKQY